MSSEIVVEITQEALERSDFSSAYFSARLAAETERGHADFEKSTGPTLNQQTLP